MVKARMTTADVAAEIACLRRLIGMRVANVYDLNPKTYVVKLARSGGVTGSGESEKELLLLESGVRLHTTQFARDKSNTPSGITLKIRKHIRTRRLEDIRQLGVDRVIDFQFGLGDQAHHLIFELYASGNILLTDAVYNVLTLLRSHRDDEKGISMMAKHRYPIETCRPFHRTTLEQITAALEGAGAQNETEGRSDKVDGTGTGEGKEGEADKGDRKEGSGSRKEKKDAKEGSPTLKDVLGQVLGYGPTLCEHCILDAGLIPSSRVLERGGKLSEAQVGELLAAVARFEDWLEPTREKPSEGFIVFQRPKAPSAVVVNAEKRGKKGKKGKGSAAVAEDVAPEPEQKEPLKATTDTAAPSEASAEGKPADGVKADGPVKLYDEFTPLLLKQHVGREWVRFETFDAAMDEFFSKVEGQKLEQQQKQQEVAALSRLDKIKADQSNRVQALQATVEQSVRKAELIEYNLDEVDSAIGAVRSALANGMDWADLKQMVKEERKAGNPVAGLIHSMQLEKNQITLLLSNNLDDMVEEEKTRPVDKVEVDISLSAFANARLHFDTKKKHAIKQQKTVDATERALKAAEKKTAEQLAQVRSMAKLTSLRKVHWFEKFHWFVSSENYLVLAGRDAQQNEQLVKKHLGKGDVYVHADLHGAATCIVKNANPEAPVPPLTLIQAGIMSVCRSSAWDAKIVTSAWWVHSHQVSKTAPTGEYLTVGSFMVRGKKNFLPPSPLVMGFGFLFRLEESCLAAHLGERRVRGEGEVDEAAEEESAPRGRRVLNEGQAPNGEAAEESDDEAADVTGEGEEGSPDEEKAEKLGDASNEVDGELEMKENESEDEDKELEAEEEGAEILDTEAAVRWANANEEKRGAGDADGDGVGSGEETSALDELLDDALAMGRTDSRKTRGSEEPTSEARGGEAKGAPKTGKRYLSKAERRKMKKGQVGDGNVGAETADNEDAGKGAETEQAASDVTEESVAPHQRMDGAAGLREGETEKEGDDEGGSVSEKEGDTVIALRKESGKEAQNESGEKVGGQGQKARATAAKGSRPMEEPTRGTQGKEELTRGKRAKLKKARDKYAEQDEEEREIRMALLASAGKSDKGTGKGGKKGGKDARGKGGEPEKMKRESAGPVQDERKVCYKCKQAGHVAKDCPTGEVSGAALSGTADSATAEPANGKAGRIGQSEGDKREAEGPEGARATDEVSAEKGSDGTQLSRRARARAQNEGERAEIAAILEEENLQELPDEERDRLTELDALTGVPRADDILLYAVPMCGPYTALQGCKFKVKLTPGTAKKGKAAKTAVEVFSRMPEATRREKELMKAVQDPDLVAVMLGNAKVTAPGLTKMKQTQKKGRKASAQKQ